MVSTDGVLMVFLSEGIGAITGLVWGCCWFEGRMLTGARILGTSSLRRNSIAPGLKDAMRPWRNVHFR